MPTVVTNGNTATDTEPKTIPKPPEERRIFGVARKSTSSSSPASSVPATTTRRQIALANKEKEKTHAVKVLEHANEKWMANFDPDRSARERRKLNRKINSQQGVRRPVGALYDEFGIHVSSDVDLCDCLKTNCSGCFFPCPKCKSLKCGLECRVNRKFIYDQLEYNGCDLVIKNPLMKY